MATNSDNFLLSKENIQPLKEGRSTSKLDTALHAQYDDDKFKELAKEKEKYETLIRTYKGDDPLQLWCDYVLFVEQSFPTNSQKGNLPILLQKCLTYFKEKSEYFNDLRLIKLWIKYLEYVKNSTEMFGIIYSHGIGKKTALFYRWWAYEYEKEDDFKKADKVYILGFKNKAEPLDELEFAHNQFQIKVAQMFLGKKSGLSEPPMPKREVLASLRHHGPSAPVLRHGNDFVKGRAGVIKQNIEENKQKPKLRVYQDENQETDHLRLEYQHMTHVPSRDTIVKENTQAPGPWNKKLAHSVNAPQSHAPHTNFEIFEEASSTPSNQHMTTNLDVLKSKGSDLYPYDVPIYINEPPDDSKKSMYPKHLVYAGGQEFQLEEVMYLLRKENEEQKAKEQKDLFKDELQNKDYLENENVVENKNEEIAQNLFNINPTKENDPEIRENATDKEESLKTIDSDWEEPIRKKHSFITSRKSRRNKIIIENEVGSNSICNLQESMTVNTKEVQKLMKNFWSDETSTIIESTTTKESSIRDLNKEVLLKDKEFEIFLNDDQKEIQSNFVNKNQLPNYNECENIKIPKEFSISNKEKLKSEKKFDIFDSDQEKNNDKVLEKDDENNLKVNKKEFFNYTEENNELKPKTDFSIFTEDDKNKANKDFVSFTEDEGNKQKKKFTIFTEDEENKPKKDFAIFTEDEENKPKKDFAIFTEEDECKLKTDFAIFSEDEEIKQKRDFNIFRDNEEIKSKNDFDVLSENIQVKREDFPLLPITNKEFQTFPQTPKNQTLKDREFELFLNDEKDSSKLSLKHLPMEIPFVSSPGMTDDELFNLRGTETKENLNIHSQNKNNGIQFRRPLAGTLLPSKNIPFLPLDKQRSDEEDEDLQNDDAPLETTCLTQAFKLPLPASTPNKFQSNLIKNSPVLTETYENPNNEISNELPINSEKKNTLEEMINLKRTYALSPIMETSKESTSSSLGILAARYPSQTLGENLPVIPETRSISELQNMRDHLELEEKEKDITNNLVENEICSVKKGKCLFDECLLNEEINPFDENNIKKFLERIDFSLKYKNIQFLEIEMPTIALNKNLTIGTQTYKIDKMIGDGGFAKVYKTSNLNNQDISLKVQKPACPWEAYISAEIKLRLNDPEMVKYFGLFNSSYIYLNGSILFADFSQFGTLLDIVNKMKTSVGLKHKMELCSFIWAKEMIMILKYLKKCNIIHADIKPDNFLVQHLLFTPNCPPSIKLIDFGRSIDMSLYPEDITFSTCVNTDQFQCTEMISKLPWTYQIDYFGVAASIHCTLFGNYMKVQKQQDKWNHSSFYPRYYNKKFWMNFFHTMLNIESCQKIPNLDDILIELKTPLEQGLRFHHHLSLDYLIK